jgi:hypothetical protein
MTSFVFNILQNGLELSGLFGTLCRNRYPRGGTPMPGSNSNYNRDQTAWHRSIRAVGIGCFTGGADSLV